MGRIGIYYGSSTGSTQEVAEELAKQLGVAKTDLHDVASADANFADYDTVLFGSSTLSLGELQDDWDSYIDKVKKSDLNGKKVALFGCGDASSYSDTFCDALGIIYNAIKDKGCTLIGQTSTDGYEFDESVAVVDDQFVGLVIDNDNESDKTADRIAAWVGVLKTQL